MRIKEAKTIAISDFLAKEWIQPIKQRRNWAENWYSSPLRTWDSNPSFKVDNELNLWFDHGLAIGGDLIDLVRQLHSVTVSGALAILGEGRSQPNQAILKKKPLGRFSLELPFINNSPAGEKEKDSFFTITSTGDITSPALIQYLDARKINVAIAKHYLQEIRFKPRNQLKEYFALGWPNGEGYEARSKFFKGFVGTWKDISMLGFDLDAPLLIFEGFIDYLSYLTYKSESLGKNPVIILNSTSLRNKALAAINEHRSNEVHLFLDNDKSWRECTEFLITQSKKPKLMNCAQLYKDNKDLNEWWVQTAQR